MCYNKKINRIRNAIMLIIIIFIFANKVDAASCSTSDKSTLATEAKNVEIIPYMDEDYDPFHNYKYNVYITNLSNNYYIVDSIGNRFEYEESYTNDSVFGMYEPGEKVVFRIYGASNSKCADVLLTSYTVKFDYYNDYSTYKECEGIEEFYLCKRNYSGTIESEEWFLAQIEGYRNGTIENEVPEDKQEKLSFFEKIITFFKEHKIILALLIIIVIVVIILLIIKLIKDRKKIKIKFEDIRERGEKYEKDK